MAPVNYYNCLRDAASRPSSKPGYSRPVRTTEAFCSGAFRYGKNPISSARPPLTRDASAAHKSLHS